MSNEVSKIVKNTEQMQVALNPEIRIIERGFREVKLKDRKRVL